MKPVAAALLLALLLLNAARVATARGPVPKHTPELIVDVDVFDEIGARRHKMTEAEVTELVVQLKRNGCDTLLIRCGCHDVFLYPSTLSHPFGFDAQHARAHPLPPREKDIESYVAWRTQRGKRCAEVIRDVNPVAAFIRAGHARGMKVMMWIDLFDAGWPGYRSKFLDEHPHCQWVGRDGKTRFEGLMDYSWPEAREFRVSQARELLDLGADGIHCSTCCHLRHLPNTHEEDFYGFSEPVVSAFQAKYGVDIRTAKDFDKAAWHDLKGQAMVQLYRDLAKLCHQRGKRLWIGLHLGRYTQFHVDPLFSTNVVARYSNHWRTLVDDGIADAFIVGDYEIMSKPDGAYWTAKPDIQRRGGEDLFAWAAREYQAYCKGRTRLYVFSEWLARPLEPRLQFWTDVVLKHGFDGIDMHEARDFEADPANMALLGAMAKRLKSGKQRP